MDNTLNAAYAERCQHETSRRQSWKEQHERRMHSGSVKQLTRSLSASSLGSLSTRPSLGSSMLADAHPPATELPPLPIFATPPLAISSSVRLRHAHLRGRAGAYRPLHNSGAGMAPWALGGSRGSLWSSPSAGWSQIAREHAGSQRLSAWGRALDGKDREVTEALQSRATLRPSTASHYASGASLWVLGDRPTMEQLEPTRPLSSAHGERHRSGGALRSSASMGFLYTHNRPHSRGPWDQLMSRA